MSLTCLSHTKNCTLKNALLWGMCRSHFYQVRIQSQLDSKIAHLVLAVFESIPALGQIVSLIELKIVQFYARLEPTSCIPRITTVTYQESISDLRRIWPTDLKLLGLTESQKTEVDSHVREAFKAVTKGGELSFHKKGLKYTDGIQTIDATLPITLSIFTENGNATGIRVLLFPKTIFASGGERKIRWVYDLTRGTFLLKKRITGLFEEKLLKYLQPLRIERGIQTSLIWRTSSDKQNKEKQQMIEPVRDGTLSILFGTAPLSSFSVKHHLILDLLNDLNALHLGQLSGVTLTPTHHSPFESAAPEELSYQPFHSDIKPLNVLVFFQNGKWRAELCDFGAGAANPTAFTISIGFTPPEYIRFYQEKRPFGIQQVWFDNNLDHAQFTIKHGQGRDVWAMGLVILSLLVEREEEATWENFRENCRKKVHIPPLPCLKSILSGRLWDRYDEGSILNLKQKTLDADIDLLEKETASKHPEQRTEITRTFKMLKGMMLRIDPNERKTIAECLAFLQQESLQIA